MGNLNCTHSRTERPNRNRRPPHREEVQYEIYEYANPYIIDEHDEGNQLYLNTNTLIQHNQGQDENRGIYEDVNLPTKTYANTTFYTGLEKEDNITEDLSLPVEAEVVPEETEIKKLLPINTTEEDSISVDGTINDDKSEENMHDFQLVSSVAKYENDYITQSMQNGLLWCRNAYYNTQGLESRLGIHQGFNRLDNTIESCSSMPKFIPPCPTCGHKMQEKEMKINNTKLGPKTQARLCHSGFTLNLDTIGEQKAVNDKVFRDVNTDEAMDSEHGELNHVNIPNEGFCHPHVKTSTESLYHTASEGEEGGQDSEWIDTEDEVEVVQNVDSIESHMASTQTHKLLNETSKTNSYRNRTCRRVRPSSESYQINLALQKMTKDHRQCQLLRSESARETQQRSWQYPKIVQNDESHSEETSNVPSSEVTVSASSSSPFSEVTMVTSTTSSTSDSSEGTLTQEDIPVDGVSDNSSVFASDFSKPSKIPNSGQWKSQKVQNTPNTLGKPSVNGMKPSNVQGSHTIPPVTCQVMNNYTNCRVKVYKGRTRGGQSQFGSRNKIIRYPNKFAKS